MGQKYMAGGRHHLPPVTAEVNSERTSLNGTWEINLHPQAASVNDTAASAEWHKIQVPGEVMMQGLTITNDSSFLYRKNIRALNKGDKRRHIIRLNGVYSYAKVYCNGHLVRDHFGGFTAWDADITPYMKQGKDNWIHIAVTDRADDISYASGYAKHPIGGILRKVDYLMLPANRLEYLYAQAGLANGYKDGTLKIETKLNTAKSMSVLYRVKDKSGKEIASGILKKTGDIFKDSIVIPSVRSWTAEDPQLYTLVVESKEGKKSVQEIQQHIGFRSVEIKEGNQLLVNGSAVKLRGACRHDMHPLLGRSTNRAQDSLDVILAKQANMNFIRTSHYPPSEDFLEFCDRYGMYVQQETAICFVISWREGVYAKYYKTMDDPAFTDRYLGQLSEMIDRDRNHASIIMWSIGNESQYGSNFQKEYDFVKSVDLSRPVSWSWPATALDTGKRCFDILVSHYPNWNGQGTDLGKYEKNMEGAFPIIGDEWAHVSCYNTDLISYDPNVKDFWGRSLDSMWVYRFDKKGYAGGAIWGMIDETFHLKDTVTGYGPWGFVDVWRRKKPEFWSVKKAYSPVRLDLKKRSTHNNRLSVPVWNRFDHTNLSAIKAVVVRAASSDTVTLPNIAPHGHGILTLQYLPSDTSLLVQFRDQNNELIDEESIAITKAASPSEKKALQKWQLSKKGEEITIQQGDILFKINNTTGALIEGRVNGKILLRGTPKVVINKPRDAGAYKNTEGIFSGAFKSTSSSIDSRKSGMVVISSSGFVDKYPVSMKTLLGSDGGVSIQYVVDSLPAYTWDIGIGLPVASTMNSIKWQRKGYWSSYPGGHLSASTGEAARYPNIHEEYRKRPTYDPALAMHDYYIKKSIDTALAKTNGSEMYRGRKENILEYSLMGPDGTITVLSDGKQSAKMNSDKNGQELMISDKWDYWTLSWGNYQGTRNTSTTARGNIYFKLKK